MNFERKRPTGTVAFILSFILGLLHESALDVVLKEQQTTYVLKLCTGYLREVPPVVEQLGNEVDKMSIEREDQWDVLKIIISTKSSDRKNEHTYLISIPHDKMEEAARLVSLYLSYQ